MKVGLVHNPSAGKGDYTADDLGRALKKAGYAVSTLSSDCDLRGELKREPVDFVAVAGGDGTQRRAALELIGTGIPIAPLPLGTANNVGRSFGIRGTPQEIIAGWRPDRPRAFDVGMARGPWGERPFLEGCGLGIIGRSISIIEEIDHATSREFDEPEDKLHRDLSVYIALVHELSTVRIEMEFDGREAVEDVLLLEILNIRHAGPRIELTRAADPTDGFLDIVMATSGDRERLRHSLQSCLSGKTPDPILDHTKTRAVKLKLGPAEFRIDDEVVLRKAEIRGKADACVELSFEVVPGALQVIGSAP